MVSASQIRAQKMGSLAGNGPCLVRALISFPQTLVAGTAPSWYYSTGDASGATGQGVVIDSWRC